MSNVFIHYKKLLLKISNNYLLKQKYNQVVKMSDCILHLILIQSILSLMLKMMLTRLLIWFTNHSKWKAGNKRGKRHISLTTKTVRKKDSQLERQITQGTSKTGDIIEMNRCKYPKGFPRSTVQYGAINYVLKDNSKSSKHG